MILYKYYPCSYNSITALMRKGLWCHFPKYMNDPFESLGYQPNIISTQQINELRKYINSSGTQLALKFKVFNDNQMRDYFGKRKQILLEKFAFCALSENYDDILMWSHYADSHKGFVLGIEFPDLEKRPAIQKVRYLKKEEEEDVDLIKIFKFMEGDNSLFNYAMSTISVKSFHWSYEEEWRIWTDDKGFNSYENNLKEIIFGIRTSDDQIHDVFNATAVFGDDHPLELSRMQYKDDPIGLKKVSLFPEK